MRGRLMLYALLVLAVVVSFSSCGRKGPPTFKDYKASQSGFASQGSASATDLHRLKTLQ